MFSLSVVTGVGSSMSGLKDPCLGFGQLCPFAKWGAVGGITLLVIPPAGCPPGVQGGGVGLGGGVGVAGDVADAAS